MSPDRMLGDLETAGFLFESLVAHDLRIYAGAAGASCFHYRDADGRLEVDYVLENGTSLAYSRDDGVHVVPLGALGP